MMNFALSFRLPNWLFCSLLLTVLPGTCIHVSAQKSDSKKTDKAISKKMMPAIDELIQFVALPNDAVSPEDIDKNLEWAAGAFVKRGFKTKVLSNTTIPVFFAEKQYASSNKTVLFYFHLDGQPVRKDEWAQKDPYSAVLKEKTGTDEYKDLSWERLSENINDEWRIFARSSSDDKGPIIMFLQAMDLLEEEKRIPPYNIKVVLDTQEEKGSAGLKESMEQYKETYRADALIVMDGPMHSSNIPTLTLGCRGGAGFSITTYGPIVPQHSGHFGNYAPNPAFRLARILASMKDEQGRVLVDGFYDGITFDEQAKAVMAAVPDNKQEINERLAIAEEEKVGNNYQEALQYPSLNIKGMRAGIVGKGGGTIIPEEAVAGFDIRLVPETDGKRMLELVKKHIEKQGFVVLDHEPTREERLQHKQLVFFNGTPGSAAFRTDINAPLSRWLRSTLKQTHGVDAVVIRIMGGSVPVTPFIAALDIPAAIVPLVNIDNNQHSPNENLRIGNLRSGIKTCYGILTSPLEAGLKGSAKDKL